MRDARGSHATSHNHATVMIGTAMIASPMMLPEGPEMRFRESASAEVVFLLPGLKQPRT